MAHSAALSSEQYNYDIVKKFAIVSIIWGILGMTAGVYIASELAWPFLNFDVAQITFGRLRPLHTSGVIFGFGGNALFATSYYVIQRTCQTRLAGGTFWPNFTFWGWNLSVLLAGLLYLHTPMMPRTGSNVLGRPSNSTAIRALSFTNATVVFLPTASGTACRMGKFVNA